MAHFEIKDLSFAYPASEKQVLKNINLTINKGEYITICGRSGSGKSTLLRHLKSVLTPHGKVEGEILFDGKPLAEADLRTQASEIGYVMQNPDSQIVTDKVWHELAFGLESLGVDQKTIRLRVAEMASYFGIQSWFHKDVSELSGGQKQLLNLAAIMAMQPGVLILDEPTSQLDPIAAADFINTVRKINLELGTTVIITEHRLEDIFHASDRVVVLDDGMIIADDEPRAAGEKLKRTNNKMFAALPVPMKVYYGVKDCIGAGEDFPFSENPSDIKTKTSVSSDCPLTVREGRNWLSTFCAEKEMKTTALDEAAEERIIGIPAVIVKNAWFRYEKNAPDILKGASFSVPKGSIYAIVGGNGTGKSTMLRAVCDICRPYRGEVLIDGKRVSKYKSSELFKGNLAMLPQDPQSIFVKKTVREDLEEMISGGLVSDSDDGAEGAADIMRIAELCDIVHLLDSHPYDLSGGEQQRAALAKVLLTQPKILLLDEPTKGIDNFFKMKFAEIMQHLKAQGVTVIMVSHDVEFCAKYADAVSMFFDGNIITTNTPKRFFSQNSFYTTAANRMSRHVFENAITDEDVIRLCEMNM